MADHNSRVATRAAPDISGGGVPGRVPTPRDLLGRPADWITVEPDAAADWDARLCFPSGTLGSTPGWPARIRPQSLVCLDLDRGHDPGQHSEVSEPPSLLFVGGSQNDQELGHVE